MVYPVPDSLLPPKALISLIEVIYLTIGIQNAVFWAIFALASLGVYRAIVSGISTMKKIVYILILMILALILPFTILGLTLPSLPLADWLRLSFALALGDLDIVLVKAGQPHSGGHLCRPRYEIIHLVV